MDNKIIEELLNFDSYYEKEELEIEMFDDILDMEDELIPMDRAKKLQQLLIPLKIENGHLVEMECYQLDAAIILASWGYEEGLHYLRELVKYGLEIVGGCYPHHLRNYDRSYEWIMKALVNYNIRLIDRGNKKEETLSKTLPIFVQIIDRAKNEYISLLGLKYKMIDDIYYKALKIPLEETLEYIQHKEHQHHTDEYNIEDIALALTRPNLLEELANDKK